MKTVFIDTDILLDFYFARKPYGDYAEQILVLCENKKLEAFISAQSIITCYYFLRKEIGKVKAVEHLQYLLQIVEIIEINKQDILMAFNSNFTELEEALLHQAATKTEFTDAIITRNPKDFKNAVVPVMSAADFIKKHYAAPSGRIIIRPE